MSRRRFVLPAPCSAIAVDFVAVSWIPAMTLNTRFTDLGVSPSCAHEGANARDCVTPASGGRSILHYHGCHAEHDLLERQSSNDLLRMELSIKGCWIKRILGGRAITNGVWWRHGWLAGGSRCSAHLGI